MLAEGALMPHKKFILINAMSKLHVSTSTVFKVTVHLQIDNFLQILIVLDFKILVSLIFNFFKKIIEKD